MFGTSNGGFSTQQNVAFFLLFSSLGCYFLANSSSPLHVVQAIYKSNFWNECPTPFRLGLERRGLEEEEEG